MKLDLEEVARIAYKNFTAELDGAQFCHVESTNSRKGKWRYSRMGESFRLPKDPGVYVVYPLDSDEPIYAGEAKNLRQRVEYHFSESNSAKKYSTLKKSLREKGFPVNLPTCEIVRFKYIVIPFGRREIEELFHIKYGINTAEGRTS